ncbi:putative inactive purple acid phosphatase 16 [Cinnamomum micranthum f. kanehirae]|uniref:Putative inactive purple acid phosphatase 16 n=1 Tax=Cinnamomum micranthum f. kanehirae TaxID=337451 RepID=A0A3S3N8G6_9MAGN|nr:putative inactive purple acid phosphatase 16 [Cinnamomum micranthum f. kanehirae]
MSLAVSSISLLALILFSFTFIIFNSKGQCTHVSSLKFSPNSSFKIALFADLHYGEATSTDWGPQQDKNSSKAMSTLLDRERPANNLLIANASYYWEQAISPTRKRGIPWATVFGNHDDASFVWPSEWFSATGIPHVRCPPKTLPRSGEGTCSFRGTTRLELMKGEIERNNLSCSESGPMDLWPSVSNYVLQMKSSENPKSTVAFLYFLDSGGGSYPEVISNAQARWFQQKSQEINPGSRLPVTPVFDYCKDERSVNAIFVGHNHGLDWCCPTENFWLCYARHTGLWRGVMEPGRQGLEIIDITEQPFSIKSWIGWSKEIYTVRLLSVHDILYFRIPGAALE